MKSFCFLKDPVKCCIIICDCVEYKKGNIKTVRIACTMKYYENIYS